MSQVCRRFLEVTQTHTRSCRYRSGFGCFRGEEPIVGFLGGRTHTTKGKVNAKCTAPCLENQHRQEASLRLCAHAEALFVMATAAALVSATEAIVPFSFFVSLAEGRCEGRPEQFLHPVISPGEPFVEGAIMASSVSLPRLELGVTRECLYMWWSPNPGT